MNKEQGFLLLIIGIAAFLSLLIVLPFLEFVIMSVVFAYILHPVNRRLETRIGSRLSPILVILGALLVLFIPLGYILLVFFRDLSRIARGETGLEIEEIERQIYELTGETVSLEAVFSRIGSEIINVLFDGVAGVVTTGLFLSLGVALLLFLMYYLLKDGSRFVDWTIHVTPIDDIVCRRLIHQIDRTTWGVIVGHMFVALVQGIVGGIGLAIAGIPNFVFWTFVMIVLSLLPLIGAFMVWAPAAGYLLLVGQTEWGIFLAAYGIVVVSMIDNYARPIVIDREAHLNPGIILIGVFGGIYAIGFSGLFVGPIILGILAATLTTFDEEFDSLGG